MNSVTEILSYCKNCELKRQIQGVQGGSPLPFEAKKNDKKGFKYGVKFGLNLHKKLRNLMNQKVHKKCPPFKSLHPPLNYW